MNTPLVSALLLSLAALLPAEAPMPFVRCEVVAIALHQPLEDYFIQNGEGRSTIHASLTGLDLPVAYHGPARLSLMPPLPAVSAPDAPPPAPAAQVDLPPGASRVLLICIQRPNEALHLIAVDISANRIPASSYFFINFTPKELRIQLEEETFSLSPGQTRRVGRAEWREESIDLPIRIATETNGRNRLVFSSIWGHHPERRHYVFALEGQHASMPVVLRKILDMPPAETTP